jgi:hypothetical protein
MLAKGHPAEPVHDIQAIQQRSSDDRPGGAADLPGLCTRDVPVQVAIAPEAGAGAADHAEGVPKR